MKRFNTPKKMLMVALIFMVAVVSVYAESTTFYYRDTNETSIEPGASGFTYTPTSSKGYTFAGWSTKPDAWDNAAQSTVGIVAKTGGTDANAYDAGDFTPGTEYYAVWKNNGKIVLTQKLNIHDTTPNLPDYGITYSNADKKLTLNGITIDKVDDAQQGIMFSTLTNENITIEVVGDNNRIGGVVSDGDLSNQEKYNTVDAIDAASSITLTGSGKLYIYDQRTGINAYGKNITISSGFTGSLIIREYGDTPADCCLKASNVSIAGGTIDLYSHISQAIDATTTTVSGGILTLKGGDNAVNGTLKVTGSLETKASANIDGTGAATVTPGDGNVVNVSGKKYVSVSPSSVSVTGVALNKSTATLAVGSDETLTATVDPTNATDKTVTWSSSDATVATVDTTGKVTAVKVGTATITVTTTDGSKTASCTVAVANHSHSWTYSKSADGKSFVATCTGAGTCPIPDKKVTLGVGVKVE